MQRRSKGEKMEGKIFIIASELNAELLNVTVLSTAGERRRSIEITDKSS